MTVLEFMARVEAVTSMSGIHPYTVDLPANAVAELQADVIKMGGLVEGFSGGWPLGYSGERTDAPVMRLGSVYVFIGEGPVWS